MSDLNKGNEHVIDDKFKKKVEILFSKDLLNEMTEMKDLMGILVRGEAKEKFASLGSKIKEFANKDTFEKIDDLFEDQNEEEREKTREKIKQVLKEMV